MKRALLLTALLAAAAIASAQDAARGERPSISKVNGGITASAGAAYGDLSTVNGGIRLERGARVGDVDTVNGGIGAAEGVSAGSLGTVNGGIRIGQRARITGGVETVNGGVFIDRGGDVRRGVSTVNGAIGLVDTDLGGGIQTVNGDITVGMGSHVRGGIRVEKPSSKWGLGFGKRRPPRVVIGPGAVVEGPLVFEREVTLHVHDTARIGAVSGATARRFSSPTPPRE